MSSDMAMTAIFGEVGYDFVVADMEHGRVDLTNLLGHVYAARATNTVLLVRVPENNASIIQRCLDAGAGGIVVPRVASAADAQRAVEAARYAPGGRGKCPIVPAAGFARDEWDSHSSRTNEEVLVMPILETQAGVDNASEICAVEGVDHVFFGHADLGQDVRFTPESDPARFRELWERVVASGQLAGASVGAAFRSTFDGDADFVTVATDVGSVREGAERGLDQARAR
jgi:4-hydroxy-2-oxoheptanedioate aldolase